MFVSTGLREREEQDTWKLNQGRAENQRWRNSKTKQDTIGKMLALCFASLAALSPLADM